MINSVRNTVLAIINKNNYGYLSPNDFNLFAKQAQLDLFDEYFFQYNQQINEENARLSGTGYADLKKGYEEVIDYFSVTQNLTQSAANIYFLPSEATTGSEYYLINEIRCSTGGVFKGIAETVSNSKITLLNNSLLTAPSTTYPAYTQEADKVTVYPISFNGATDVKCQYIRYPKDPKWTYTTISNGDPIFNQSQLDYQDFELPLDDGNDLVSKILQYAGIQIREGDVFKFGQVEEQTQNKEQ